MLFSPLMCIQVCLLSPSCSKRTLRCKKVPNSGPGGGDVTQRHTASPLGLQVPLEVTSLIPPPPGQEPYQAHPRPYAHDQMGKGVRGQGPGVHQSEMRQNHVPGKREWPLGWIMQTSLLTPHIL